MLNALTIDVEDYYQVSALESVVRFKDWSKYESRVERNTYRLLDILDENKVRATFFVLGWVAERHPNLVMDIQKRGHEVASHGYSHKRIYMQTPDQFRDETRRSKALLEEIINQPVIGYRAASYSITRKSLWALDILSEEGFRYDSSIFPIHHALYGIPGSQRFNHKINRSGNSGLIELPLSTLRFCGYNFPIAGGGYLRFFPYAFTRWAIRQLNENEKQPAVVYLHPWEIDPNQPRIRAKAISRFRHYLNLGGLEGKLIRILRDFKLSTMADVLRHQNFLK